MTEKLDSLAFFDQLAATSQSNVEHELPYNPQLTKRQLDTVKPFKKEEEEQVYLNQNDFHKKWLDFTRAYRTEKEVLCEHLKDQMIQLEALEQQFEKENFNIHDQITASYHDFSNHISQHKENIQSEKKQYNNEIKLLKEIRKFQDEKIKLNVGGQLFETSLTTLRRDPNSMLADMFGKNKIIKPDVDDSYFIDRDGTYFRLVLNYLRDLRIPSGVAEDPKIMDELMQEAQYYRLHDLLKIKWSGLAEITQEELVELYPLSNNPVVFSLEKKDLSGLDFSGYFIDPNSSFMGSNLENCQFANSKFILDFTQKINFSNTFLVGATFPREELDLDIEGAVPSDELNIFASKAVRSVTRKLNS